METVYKYCGAFGADILRHLELKVTPPNQFNDQLEFTPKMICSDPVRWAKQALTREDVLTTLYQGFCLERKFLGSFSEFQQILKDPPPEMIKTLGEAAQDRLAIEEKEFLDHFSNSFGILCLSQSRDSVPMWGHYCDKPLGLVVGLDRSAPVFQKAKAMRPVDYDRKARPVLDICWEVGSHELKHFEDQIIFSKSGGWRYEGELRQAFMLSSFTPRPVGEKGTRGYFLRIEPEVIVSVTLGPRCSPEQEEYIRTVLQNPWLSHVKQDRARVDEDNFSLRFEPIS